MLIALEAQTGQLDGADTGHWLAMLSPAECSRYQAMASASRQRSFLLGRVVLRSTLARQLAIEPGQVVIDQEPGGRPFLGHPGWCFSLSHVEDQLVLVLTDQASAVGVDLEWPRGERPWRRLAQRRLPASQARVVASAPPGAEAARFCTYWTLLEALAKAHGRSVLDDSLWPSSEALANRRNRLHQDEAARSGQGWFWWHWVRAGRHCSLVVQGDSSRPCWIDWQTPDGLS